MKHTHSHVQVRAHTDKQNICALHDVRGCKHTRVNGLRKCSANNNNVVLFGNNAHTHIDVSGAYGTESKINIKIYVASVEIPSNQMRCFIFATPQPTSGPSLTMIVTVFSPPSAHTRYHGDRFHLASGHIAHQIICRKTILGALHKCGIRMFQSDSVRLHTSIHNTRAV